MMKTISVVSALMLVLSGCTSITQPTKYIGAGKSPQTRYASFSKEESQLACFAIEKWGPSAKETAIAVTQIIDQSNKATYGDEGTGPMMPTNSAISASRALGMVSSAHSRIIPINREKWMMDTMTQEATTALNGQRLRERPKPILADLYLNGTISGVDALAASVQEYAYQGFGGGPSQQRWEITLDLQLTDGSTTGIPYTTSVKHEFVQTEFKLFAAKILGGGKAASFAGADIQEAVRSEMQGQIKPMIYSAVADLVRQLPGSPKSCGAKVQNSLSDKAS